VLPEFDRIRRDADHWGTSVAHVDSCIADDITTYYDRWSSAGAEVHAVNVQMRSHFEFREDIGDVFNVGYEFDRVKNLALGSCSQLRASVVSVVVFPER
jgi:hypothetical protein